MIAKKKMFAAALLLSGAVASVQGASGPREKLSMDGHWIFRTGDPEIGGKLFDYPETHLMKQSEGSEAYEVEELPAKRVDAVKTNLGGELSWVKGDVDESQWRPVTLPHDWAIEMPFDKSANRGKGFRRLSDKDGTGIGWYRRRFELPAEDQGKTIWIEFGGAYRNTLVWLNGHCLGRMESGYTPFYYDVTKFLNYGGKNLLVARCDATKDEGWFYEGAGLYRHVWMIKTQPQHVAHWGTFVTSKVDGTNATVSIETTVENAAAQPAKVDVVSILLDGAGAEIVRVKSAVEVSAAGQSVVKQTTTVANPKLWSPETPNLYALVTRIETGGVTADDYRTPFGIRTIRFTPEGFFLNGQKRFIKGVCNHQDFAGVGVAVPDRVQQYRVAMLKEMGCDGWRTAHNPVNEELLDECDRQGMMVMDETRRFGCYAQPLADLKAMMLRDRNHPSIVIWSLANEEGGAGSVWGAKAIKIMQDLAHQLDPSRPCTAGMNTDVSEIGFPTVLDVTGTNYRRDLDRYHKENPQRCFIGTEEASTLNTRGSYFRNPRACLLTAYDEGGISTSESWVNYYHDRPWMAGAFVWTGYDYRGEPVPYDWPCIGAQFGILDICGFPKDNYYYYKAWWTDEPVLHLYPHWNWNQIGHTLVQITVKTTLPQSEVWWAGVLVDDDKLGDKDMKNGSAQWSTLDTGDLKNVAIILRKSVNSTDGSGKAKVSFVEVARQVIPLGQESKTVELQSGPEGAKPGENQVMITRVVAPIKVWVQTNYREVELFVNGVSRGRQTVKPMCHVEWTVPYEPGKIAVTAYKDGKAVRTETLETTGPAAALRLTANRTSLLGDGEDVVLIKTEALDDQGRFVPTAGNLVHFEVSGSGRLLGVGNGDPACLEADQGPERSLFNGLALGLVQSSRSTGPVIVKATAPGLKAAELTLPVQFHKR